MDIYDFISCVILWASNKNISNNNNNDDVAVVSSDETRQS